MRRLLPNGIAGIVAFALAITAAGTAVAYFTTMGAGDSTPTGISQLAKPTIATATPAAGGTVALTRGVVTAPGSGTVTYSVSRDGKAASGTCAATLTVVSCTDSGLEPGTYTYVVTAKWRSWTATGSAKAATVTVGPADHFVLGAASLTPSAGAADNLTITAKDAKGSTVTTYAGSHNLTFSGASASPSGAVPTVTNSAGGEIAFGSSTSLSFGAGVATVAASQNGAMKLYKTGSTSLTATDGTLLTPTPLVVTVAAAAATRFTLSASVTSLTAGGSSNLTTTAWDAYGNVATGYAGSHNLTFSGAATIGANKPTVVSSGGTATAFGTATTINFTAGVATVTSSKNGLMKIYASGEAGVEVSEGTISTAAPLEVTVAPAAASKLVLAAATLTPTAGIADNLTVTAQDTYGNTAVSYVGSHSLTFTGALASPDGTVATVSDSSGTDVAFGTVMPIAFSPGVATVSGTKNGAMKLYRAGSTAVKVSDGTFSVTLTVTVGPESASEFTLLAASTTPVAAATDNLTTTALDQYGNTDTNYAGSHNLTFTGSSASPNGTLPNVIDSAGTTVNFGLPTAISFTAGVAKVASSKNGVMKLYRAGAASISVSDGSISSPTPVAATVSPTSATRWALTNINVSAGTLGPTCLFICTLTGLGNSGTVTAKVAVTDAYGNTVSAVGTGHAAKVTTNGTGTISGTPLTIPSTGAAESATTFTFTARPSGTYTEILTVAASSGTAYTTATLTASK